MTGYTVIDFETTGFSPQKHDRVVEVGVVYVDPDGTVGERWGTLINPGRDMGATHVHGIRASDVHRAPTFAQIIPHLLRALSGRTVVAHNARFDVTFLEHEFHRAGVPVAAGIPAVCTMEWSRHFVRGASRKLGDCCRAVGIVHGQAHSALGDAVATAELLAYYLRAAGPRPPWGSVLLAAARHAWPPYGQLAPIPMADRPPTDAKQDAWLDRITSTMPRIEDTAIEAYVDVLERALLDGHLSEHEKDDLVGVAAQFGLAREQLDKVHRVYLTALAGAAWADGVLSDAELLQLSQVSAALSIPVQEAQHIVREAKEAAAPFELPALHLEAGDRVVFTGELSTSRDAWVERIAALGLEHGTVTKSTRVVVASDPDSLSGKAAKARSYGIPIVTEHAFEAAVEAMEHRLAARRAALA
ncbi:MAG TPA: exonuclease domain-containing protein [Nocardioides sp.]|uniref:exonuclease domain-containing protein n=1 Tax=Nocardioides sp. TaxID=35761 RepID=UPI002ED9ACE9